VFKFRDISRKVFTVFKSVLKMAKIAEIVAPWAGSNPGTLDWVGLTLSPEPIRQLKSGEILLNTPNILLAKRVNTFERTFVSYIFENEG
jgi:hypothetical protein